MNPVASPIIPCSIGIPRREMLRRIGGGFGMLGLASSLGAHEGILAAPHLPPRAKRIVFLFMNGGPSHVDTFDPKPALAKHAGTVPPEQQGRKQPSGGYMPSPFTFSRHGKSGVEMSELFPNLARHADDLCVVRSMHTDQPNHEPALLIMHSGKPQPTRPSMGSWLAYGLGSENRNLPGYVVLTGGRPVVGPKLWSSGFLPGEYQAMAVDTNDLAVDKMIANLNHPKLSRSEQRRQLDLLGTLNQMHRERRDGDAQLETQIRAMEMAFSMQAEASEAFDVSRETEAARDRYGRTVFGQSCLLARRLLEAGVRVVQVYYVQKGSNQPWDSHSSNNARHRELCADSDVATAALLTDLKERGLLEDTLVVWGGEFGRTPYSQLGKDKNLEKAGRDHHATGFSMLLAGGGIRGGCVHGATDEFGMHAVEKPVHVHDLHATLLRQLGIDHEKLTYRYSGRDFRLTDIHGKIVEGILS